MKKLASLLTINGLVPTYAVWYKPGLEKMLVFALISITNTITFKNFQLQL